jgi:RNA polymerase-binding transcription factor DksA
MTVTVSATSARPVAARSVAEIAAASLSPYAVLSARWHDHLDILASLSIQLHQNPESATNGSHTDQLSKMGLQKSIDHTRDSMRSIEAALERINHHMAGTCEACGHAIDPLRLIGLPTTSVCRRCGRRPLTDTM